MTVRDHLIAAALAVAVMAASFLVGGDPGPLPTAGTGTTASAGATP